MGSTMMIKGATVTFECYLATTRNWSIWGSLSWLLGSHTLVSSFSWTRLSASPNRQRNSTTSMQVMLLYAWTGWTSVTYPRPAFQGSLPGTWSPPGSPPGQPAGSSVQGRKPTSRRNNPGGKKAEGISIWKARFELQLNCMVFGETWSRLTSLSR